MFIKGERTSVQAEVEMPIPYILARCPSSGQQLMYSDVRLEDMIAWNKHECEVRGINIVDRIRFFKGIDSFEYFVHLTAAPNSLYSLIKHKLPFSELITFLIAIGLTAAVGAGKISITHNYFY